MRSLIARIDPIGFMNFISDVMIMNYFLSSHHQLHAAEQMHNARAHMSSRAQSCSFWVLILQILSSVTLESHSNELWLI